MTPRKRYVYTQPLFLKKAGDGTEYMKDKLVKAGRIIVLNSIAVEDKTSILTKVRIGKITGGVFFPWEEALTPAIGELSFSQEEHWLREGEQFAVELVGGAENDKCWAYIDGYWFYWDGKG